MRLASLRLRLALAGAIAISIALALSGIGLTLLFERHVYRSQYEDLDAHLRQLIGSISVDPEGRLTAGQTLRDPRFSEPYSGFYWQVTAPGRDLRSRSLWDYSLPLADDPLPPGVIHHHQILGPGGKWLLAAERPLLLPAQPGMIAARVVVASELTRLRQARDAFAHDLVPGLALLAVVLAIATWVQLTLGLRPLDVLRRRISELRDGPGRLREDAPQEVLPLVRELNRLLAAHEHSVERARGRAADLAHGLKTPLAALFADARAIRRQGETEIADSLEDIGESMLHHVERELARARLRGPGLDGTTEATPLAPVVDALIRTLAKTQKGETVRFENLVPADCAVRIDKTDLTEALGCLLDNACRHAQSRVRVRVESAGEVVVSDDGPGLAPEVVDRVAQLGVRRGTRTAGGGSAGLGLSIATDVLEAYGWRMMLGKADMGGLEVRLVPGGPEGRVA